MWFKNLIFYRFTETQDYQFDSLEKALHEHMFTPCKSQELSRYGWVSPHSSLDTPLFTSSGAFLICAQKEEKILPANVIKRKLDEKVEAIQAEQGRKVYRKEKLQMKDEIILDLLPRAFSKYSQTHALILPRANLLVVDSSSHKKAEELLNLLRNSLSTLPVVLPDVHQSPSVVMTSWLEKHLMPTPFSVLQECELKDTSEEGAVIRIKGQDLFSDEISAHIDAGKEVNRLSVCWDDQIEMTLLSDLTVKRLKPTETLTAEINEDSSEDPLARLDGDVSRLTLEYQKLIPQLLDLFGGEVER